MNEKSIFLKKLKKYIEDIEKKVKKKTVNKIGDIYKIYIKV